MKRHERRAARSKRKTGCNFDRVIERSQTLTDGRPISDSELMDRLNRFMEDAQQCGIVEIYLFEERPGRWRSMFATHYRNSGPHFPINVRAFLWLLETVRGLDVEVVARRFHHPLDGLKFEDGSLLPADLPEELVPDSVLDEVELRVVTEWTAEDATWRLQ